MCVVTIILHRQGGGNFVKVIKYVCISEFICIRLDGIFRCHQGSG